MSKFIEAIDTRSGKKVRVPSQWVELFPNHFKARKHHRPAATVQLSEPKPPQAPVIKHETKES